MMPFLPKIPIIPILFKIAKSAWEKLTGGDKAEEKLSNQKAVNPQKSEANEIVELNKMLCELRDGIKNAAEDLERNMIAECSIELQEIMDLFNEQNAALKLTRTDSVKRKFNRLYHELQGTFSEYISKKISLDNPECIKLLKLPPGDLKKQRIQELKQAVFVDACNEIVNKIRLTVEDFSDTVEDVITEHLERTEEKIYEKSTAFEELSEVKENDYQATENLQLKASYILSVCDLVENII